MQQLLQGQRRHAPLSGSAALAAVLTLAAAMTCIADAGAADVLRAGAESQAQFAIPAGPLTEALGQFAAEAGISVTAAPELVNGVKTPGVKGLYPVSKALALLLAGTGLQAVDQGGGAYTLSRLPLVAGDTTVMPLVKVEASAEPLSRELPKPYAGGQVARGAQLGLLGNRDFMDTPFSATSFTAETIQNQQAVSVTDVVANDPSIKPVVGSGGYYDEYLIRGITAGIRDIAFNGLHGVAPYSFIAAQAYERIELVKGPALLLTGNPGSLGGIVNLVPKRAEDKPITQLTALYSADENAGAHVDVGRRFGKDGEWGVRFNGLFRDGGTAIDNNERQVGMAVGAVDYRGEKLRFSADFGYQRDYVEGNRTGYSLAPGQDVPDAPSNASSTSQPFETADDKSTYGVTRTEYDITPTLTAHVALGINIYKSLLLISSPSVTSDGSTNASFTLIDFENRTITREVGLRGELQTGPVRHEWTLTANDLKYPFFVGFGSFVSGGSFTSNLYAPVRVDEPVRGAAPDPQRLAQIDTDSIGAADVMSILDGRVQVMAGARKQRIKQTFFGTAQSGDELSPAFGIVFKPIPRLSLYANYIESLEPGPVAPTTAANPGQSFDATMTDSKEVGAKFDLGSIGGTFALFELNRDSGATDPVTNLFGIIGEQRNRGAELSVFGEAAPGLRLLGGLTYLDAGITKAANPQDVGQDAPAVPRVYLTLSSEWDLPFLAGLTANGRVVHSGSSYLDVANQQEVSGWTRFDLGARYGFRFGSRPVTVRADLLNAFEKNYWQTSAGTLAQGTPRTLLLSATVDF